MQNWQIKGTKHLQYLEYGNNLSYFKALLNK